MEPPTTTCNSTARTVNANFRPLIVVPVYGDTSRLLNTLDVLSLTGHELLVVNDGNGQELTDSLEAYGYRTLALDENKGVGAATLAGIEFARCESYTGVVAVDADGAHPISAVETVLHLAKQAPGKAVISERFGHIGERYIPEEKRAANLFAAQLFNMVTKEQLPDVACGLRYYPSGFPETGWMSNRYGFIYESLEYMLRNQLVYASARIFVDYPQKNPMLTKASELEELLRFALASHAAKHSTTKIPQGLEELLSKPSSKSIHLPGKAYLFSYVPSEDSYLITCTEDNEQIAYAPKAPSRDRLSVGIIPDGGRRWAKANGLELCSTYIRTIDKICAFLQQHRQSLSGVGIYWLSEFNFRRPTSEVNAILSALDYMSQIFVDAPWSTVYYGNLERLPEDLRHKLIRHNIRACARHPNGPLVTVCVAYSADWEATLTHPKQAIWNMGFTPEVLSDIFDLRFNIVFRTGGASSLSQFLPVASSYAKLVLDSALFNDYPLELHFLEEVTRLGKLAYGD